VPDEETPRPREHTARDDAEGTPPPEAAEEAARDTPDAGDEPPAWASPAADAVPPFDADAARPARPTVGGWLGRLRSVVWGDAPAEAPAAPAWREPEPHEEPLLPPTPRFEAPPRPSLLGDESIEAVASVHLPEPPAVPAESAPAEVAPADSASLADADGRTQPEPEVRQPALFQPSPDALTPNASTSIADEPIPDAATEEAEVETPAATLAEPPAEPPEVAALPEPTPEFLDVPQTPEVPEVPEEERELVATGQVSPEVVEHAIEHALHEAEARIERASDAPPVEGETPEVPPLTLIAEALPLPDPDAESSEQEAAEREEAALIAQGGPFSRFAWPSHPRYWNGYLAVITGLVTLSFLMFVLVEPSPRWTLLVVSLGVAAGMDGVLRATWRAAFARGEDTTPYLFLPALYVFAAPLLIEHNVSGHAVLAWSLFAGVGFGAIAVAEVLSVRTGSPLYAYARMVTTGSAYFAAFSLLALTYVLDLHIVPAFVATWLIGSMLGVEVVREGEVDPMETAVFAGLVGLLLAQVRWLLFYLPLDGYLAGLALVLVFYFVTGVLHSYVVRQLNAITATEYGLVTVIGMLLVGAARVAGLA